MYRQYTRFAARWQHTDRPAALGEEEEEEEGVCHPSIHPTSNALSLSGVAEGGGCLSSILIHVSLQLICSVCNITSAARWRV